MHVKIEKLVYGGEGVGFMNGKVVFVPFSAPDDILDINIISDRGAWCRGKISKIIKPAACRVVPKCPVYGACGGCDWQHISYDVQTIWKRDILVESLERIGRINSPFVSSTVPSPEIWNYRNRIQLHVNRSGRVGFYRSGSHEIVEFKRCAIADERINEILDKNRSTISQRDRGIALRVGGDESFSQVNTEQNENIKKILCKWLSDIGCQNIMELHAGSGNFTFDICKTCEQVFASELDGRAVESAKRKMEKLSIVNVEFIRASALRAIKDMNQNLKYDAILLDPPRKGCFEIIDTVITRGIKNIIYISCDPATLARDIAKLVEGGYKHVESIPIDMFPQTHHIESINLLRLA